MGLERCADGIHARPFRQNEEEGSILNGMENQYRCLSMDIDLKDHSD